MFFWGVNLTLLRRRKKRGRWTAGGFFRHVVSRVYRRGARAKKVSSPSLPSSCSGGKHCCGFRPEGGRRRRRGNGPRRVNTPLQLPNVLLCGANLRIPSSSLFFPQRKKNRQGIPQKSIIALNQKFSFRSFKSWHWFLFSCVGNAAEEKMHRKIPTWRTGDQDTCQDFFSSSERVVEGVILREIESLTRRRLHSDFASPYGNKRGENTAIP